MEQIVTVILTVLKFIYEARTKKKLNDDQFLAYIKAHQEKRKGIADSTVDFEKEIDKL